MIIDFSFENFKSFKERQYFSMEASATREREGSTFEVDVKGIGRLRLLKSAAVFGANASGKTGLLEAIGTLFELVSLSATFKGADKLSKDHYNPFRLDLATATLPTLFKINFIGPDSQKYTYEVQIDQNAVLKEKLDHYPKGRPANLYTREVSDKGAHAIQFGKSLKGKRIDTTLFPNQLFLSKFGSTKHDQLSPLFHFFDSAGFVRAHDTVEAQMQIRSTAMQIANSADSNLIHDLNRLVATADTHINSFVIKEAQFSDFKLPDFMPEEERLALFDRIKFRVSTQHHQYKDGEIVATTEFDLLRDESHGTKILFSVGGIILEHLRSGGIMFIDELDSGLHPDLIARLVELFHNPSANSCNAQFIFTTHATSVTEKSRMRSDQIWMVEKNDQGASELFSIQDFEDVREGIPFDKWYRAGKFGAIPRFLPFSVSMRAPRE
jgi:AAA15 family ATPase/GTPase